MPHDLTNRNIELFGREVMPHLQKLWEDQPWEDVYKRQPFGIATRA